MFLPSPTPTSADHPRSLREWRRSCQLALCSAFLVLTSPSSLHPSLALASSGQAHGKGSVGSPQTSREAPAPSSLTVFLWARATASRRGSPRLPKLPMGNSRSPPKCAFPSPVGPDHVTRGHFPISQSHLSSAQRRHGSKQERSLPGDSPLGSILPSNSLPPICFAQRHGLGAHLPPDRCPAKPRHHAQDPVHTQRLQEGAGSELRMELPKGADATPRERPGDLVCTREKLLPLLQTVQNHTQATHLQIW